MADEAEDDVLGEDHADDTDGAWLDIHLPTLVHQQLEAFGSRMGLTADGYAKLLIFQALHPLVAAEANSSVARETSEEADNLKNEPYEFRVPIDQADFSRMAWEFQLRQWVGREDEAPAPRLVHDTNRTFHADDFEWTGSPKPPYQWAHVDSDGKLSISRDSAPGEASSL